MRSKAHVGPRALHPVLALVPAAGVLFALVFDVVHVATGADAWWLATLPVLPVGFLGAVAATIVGLFDLIEVVPDGRPTVVASAHALLNLALVFVLALDTHVRWSAELPVQGTPGFAWSLLSAALLVASGWLGWTLVQTHHVGVLEVDEGGDAPVLPSPGEAHAR